MQKKISSSAENVVCRRLKKNIFYDVGDPNNHEPMTQYQTLRIPVVRQDNARIQAG
jgi:hypothetical protein